jgi:hypothetical protein
MEHPHDAPCPNGARGRLAVGNAEMNSYCKRALILKVAVKLPLLPPKVAGGDRVSRRFLLAAKLAFRWAEPTGDGT